MGPGGEAELGHPFGDAGEAVGELFDAVVPVFQGEFSGEDAFGEYFGGGIEGDVLVGFLGVEGEVAEFGLLEAGDSSTRFVVVGGVGGGDFVGEEFGDPGGVDGGGAAEVGDGFAGFDFGDFAGDEGVGFADAGGFVEVSAAVTD